MLKKEKLETEIRLVLERGWVKREIDSSAQWHFLGEKNFRSLD